MDDNIATYMDDSKDEKEQRKGVWRDPFYFSWKLHTPQSTSEAQIQNMTP